PPPLALDRRSLSPYSASSSRTVSPRPRSPELALAPDDRCPTPFADPPGMRAHSASHASLSSLSAFSLSSTASSLWRSFASSPASSDSDSPPSSVASSACGPIPGVPPDLVFPLHSLSAKKLQQQWADEFRALEAEFHKFLSRTTVHKANVLRLAVLPFLREHRGEHTAVSASELRRRTAILHSWWAAMVAALRDRARPVSGADRGAYLEAVAGIMSRREWAVGPEADHDLYRQSLADTLEYCLARLALKPVPVSVSVFSGQVFARCFFWVPGVADVLLHLLAVRPADVRRLFKAAGLAPGRVEHHRRALEKLFPAHLHRLVAARGLADRPPPPPAVPSLYGPWAARWNTNESDLFASFLKHYYLLVANYLPTDFPARALVCVPGVPIINGHILRAFDFVVHRQSDAMQATKTKAHRPSTALRGQAADENTSLFSAVTTTTFGSSLPRTVGAISSMKILRAVHELLTVDLAQSPFATPFRAAFELVLQAAAARTSLYDLPSCIGLYDLADDVLRLVAVGSHGAAVDWTFWVAATQRMMLSRNTHSEVRALTFLFNFWEPIMAHRAAGLQCLDWLLADETWQYLFLHWSAMVRTYYLRLLCWRVGRVDDAAGPELRRARAVLLDRLETTYAEFKAHAAAAARPIACEPCVPIAGRRMAIVPNSDPPAGLRASTAPAPADPPPLPTSRYDVHDANLFPSKPPDEREGSLRRHASASLLSAKPVSGFSRKWRSFRSVFQLADGKKDARAKPESPRPAPPAPPPPDVRRGHASASDLDTLRADRPRLDARRSTASLAPTPAPAALARTYRFVLEFADPRDKARAMHRAVRAASQPMFLAGTLPAHTVLPAYPRLPRDLLPAREPDTTKLTYAGRSLNEWAVIVGEFEQFVRLRCTRDGATTNAEVGTPELATE
ncbi:uncharacterized protein V1510DRAFT_349118, partial [Dipodascopsis tothii]|uniref:uncharacterized protein n=1 Tax=Dipodascopsis tothii TaxID=44089 RepID=UPI0034CFE655